jgi:hypothetical protein
MQHYSQQTAFRSSQSAHQWMDGLQKCNTNTQWSFVLVIKKNKMYVVYSEMDEIEDYHVK